MPSPFKYLLTGALALSLVLTGCASGAQTAPESTQDTASKAPSFEVIDNGEAMAAAIISENFGEEPEVALPDVSLVGNLIEREIVFEGDGEPIDAESTVVMQVQQFDLESGQSSGYEALQGGMSMSNPDLLPYWPTILHGVPGDSRVAIILPSEVMAATSAGTQPVSPLMLVVDVQSVTNGQAATGTPAESTQELVTVSANPGAAPEIEVHSDQPAPTEQVIDVVLQGEGDTVEEGDYVTLQYTGLLFSDGTEFDSSWSRGGAPTSFKTTQVVTGFADALVGQSVGSRVVTVFPPELGYGDQDGGSIPPGSTLVFVIDILATM